MTKPLTSKRIDRISTQFHRYLEHYQELGVDRRGFLRLIAQGTAASTVFAALLRSGDVSASEIADARVFSLKQDASPQVGGSITIATLGDAQTINPLSVNETEGTWRAKQLFDQLIDLDLVTLEPVAAIADSWEVSDDALTYTFHLNPAVTFSDGTPLTAADIEFTMTAMVTPEVASPHYNYYAQIAGAEAFYAGDAESIEGIEVVDDHTIQITLSQPNSAWLSTLVTCRPLPKHLLEGKDLVNDPFFQAPIGAGAFAFESWEIGQQYKAVRNPHYYREGQPYLDEYVHLVRADAQTLVLEFQTDAVDASAFVPPTSAGEVEAVGNYIVEVKPPGYDVNGWNFGAGNKEELADPRVRRAIALAIDAEAFVSDFLLGLGSVAVGPIPPNTWAYNSALEPIPYDPEQAKALLEEAGVSDLTVRLTTNAGNKMREDWVTFTQQSLEEIGIGTQPDVKEWAQVVEDGTRGTFELICPTFAGALTDPDALYRVFHSGEPQNVSKYSNAEVDELLEQGRVEPDIEKRTEIYSRVQDILLEEVPVYYAWDRPFITVYRNTYGGFTNTLLNGFENLREWHLKG